MLQVSRQKNEHTDLWTKLSVNQKKTQSAIELQESLGFPKNFRKSVAGNSRRSLNLFVQFVKSILPFFLKNLRPTLTGFTIRVNHSLKQIWFQRAKKN